jgi:hypothetical protein
LNKGREAGEQDANTLIEEDSDSEMNERISKLESGS